MKEGLLEVLLYLFDNYLLDEYSNESDQEDLVAELLGAGFPGVEIDKAFAWMQALMDDANQQAWCLGQAAQTSSIRFYTSQESKFLLRDGQSLLHKLLSSGVLNQLTHEIVIDRLMALGSSPVRLEHLKWVVLLVLSNQPKYTEISEWAEVIVKGDSMPLIH